MHLTARRIESAEVCFPRTHGDAPPVLTDLQATQGFSPYARGCTSSHPGSYSCYVVFPVRTGMHPYRRLVSAPCICFPRTHGDAPFSEREITSLPLFSPYARGCTSVRRPAPAREKVFPVRTGMHPTLGYCLRVRCGFPRTHGDAPSFNFGGPVSCMFSPYARGCTSPYLPGVQDIHVFPVRTGMHPPPVGRLPNGLSFPRTHGDAPSPSASTRRRPAFSPYARGCTEA